MTQMCPSTSHQLAAAALAFRRARRKFPKNLGVCVCYGDAAGTTEPLHCTTKLSSNHQGRRNDASHQALSLSKTALWSNDRKGGIIESPNGSRRLDMVCASCGMIHSHSQMSQGKEIPDNSKTSNDICRRICARIKPVDSRESSQSHAETVSKSTHYSAGRKKKKHIRHRRQCLDSGRIKKCGSRSPPKIHICGYRDYNRKTLAVKNLRPGEEEEKIYCSDSPTGTDFPTRLQTWERRTLRGSLNRETKDVARRGGKSSFPETSSKDQIANSLRNQESSICKLHPSVKKKPMELKSNEDFCLRPSLIKAAQLKIDLEERRGRIGGRRSKHLEMKSTWDENLNVINHKDSMSILMKRFGGKEKQQSLKLQNIHELNSVLEMKTRCCGEGETLRSEKNKTAMHQRFLQPLEDIESVALLPPSKSSSGINPVAKLGRVANQALRESESCFKNVRSRLNRSGICCSRKGMPWRGVC